MPKPPVAGAEAEQRRLGLARVEVGLAAAVPEQSAAEVLLDPGTRCCQSWRNIRDLQEN